MFLGRPGGLGVLSFAPQPGLLRAWFTPTERVKSSPGGAPDEQPCDDVKISGLFTESLAEYWGRLRREKQMLWLVREYLQGILRSVDAKAVLKLTALEV